MTATMRARPTLHAAATAAAGDRQPVVVPLHPGAPHADHPATHEHESEPAPGRSVLTADRNTTPGTADIGHGALTADPSATPDTAPPHRPGLVADPRWRIASFST